MVRPSKHPHELVLRTIGVLIFIHENVLKAPIVIFPDRWHRFQQTHGLQQQVIEIQGIGFEQLFAVLRVNLRHTLGLRIGRLQIDLLRVEHVILRPGNMSQHGTWRDLLIVNPQPPHDRLNQLLLIGLIVNNEFFGEADGRSAGHSGGNAQSFNVAA